MTPKAGSYHKNLGNKEYRDNYDAIFNVAPEIYSKSELKRLKATVKTLNDFNQPTIIQQSVSDSIQVKQKFFSENEVLIEECAGMISCALENGGKLLLFGNGGSAADCQHIAAEFVGRFQMERDPIPAIALTTDTSIITAIANDYTFDAIFNRQIQAIGRPGDIAVAISTSGLSRNVLAGAFQAREMGISVVSLSGCKGRLKDKADIAFCVPSDNTARIQETHIMLAHILCDLVERDFAG
jgi:D-sedoheptulose 7-phosphate isomerase